MPVQPDRQSLPLRSVFDRAAHTVIRVSIFSSSAWLMIFSPAVAGTALLLMALIGPVSLSRCSFKTVPPWRGGVV